MASARQGFVTYATTLSEHAELFEPLHLPGSVVASALRLWTWRDGMQRLAHLAGTAPVEVRVTGYTFRCTGHVSNSPHMFASFGMPLSSCTLFAVLRSHHICACVYATHQEGALHMRLRPCAGAVFHLEHLPR